MIQEKELIDKLNFLEKQAWNDGIQVAMDVLRYVLETREWGIVEDDIFQ